MENSGQCPRMDWEARDLASAFKKFRDHAEFMFGGPLEKKSDEAKCNYFMLWIGEKGREIFSTWSVTAEEKKCLDTYMNGFEAYRKPKSNTIYSRFLFKCRTQRECETFDEFVTDLKLILRDCNYPIEFGEEMLRDHIIFGVISPTVREKLMSEGSDMSLQKCLDIARTSEMSRTQLQSMDNPGAVEAVRRTNEKRTGHNRDQRNGQQRSRREKQKCNKCGLVHTSDKRCPALGQKCFYCEKFDHFEKMCRKRINDAKSKKVNEVRSNPFDSHDLVDPDFEVNAVHHDRLTNEAFVDIGICNAILKMKIDTGAQVNVIPASKYYNLPNYVPLIQTDKCLKSYDGSPLKIDGFVVLKCRFKGKVTNEEFYIVDTPTKHPILGLETCTSLGIVKLTYTVSSDRPLTRDDVMDKYRDVFTGIGELPGECEIRLRQDAKPVIHPPRKVPFAIRDKLRTQLEEMERTKVICKVTEPTEWVNSLVTVQKSNGSLRVCLCPKDLNDAIQRPHYPSKTIDDILPDLSGATVFSKLDARSGYWSIKLTEKSSMYTTFNTPFGRYRFLRLPYGVKSANDLFTQKMDECLEDLPGVKTIVDDIVVYGKDQATHDRNLDCLLTRCRENGIRLNPDKTEIGKREIPFFGHVLTATGLKMDPSKVKAIREMPSPRTKAELQTVLGMITYLQRFAPCLAEMTSPLRQLLKKEVEFDWSEACENALKQVKDVITQNPGPVLTYFDPKKDITLQVDASKFGLGAVLLQDDRPVSYASKSLTETEINYSQIEKELFAIVFGCTRFHQYVYGRRIYVQTDHKPLIAIFKKNIQIAPPRLQRMLLSLSRYDIDLSYVPGKRIVLADTLSRKYLPDTCPNLINGLDEHVHGVMSCFPVSDQKMEYLRAETQTDSDMQSLVKVIQNGWPETRAECPKELLGYWNYRDELTVIDGIVLKGSKIFVPKACRQFMLGKIHDAHLGIEKCTQRAREVLFWPSMSNDIREVVQKCPICLEHRNSNTREPLQSSDVPEGPWQIAATDIFQWNSANYILLVDYYSRYFEVSILPDMRSTTVIERLKSYMSRHGIVQKLISDNGTQYTSQEFKQFAEKWDFTHVTSSPAYPKSNGLAERTVQTIKSIFTKAKQSGKEPYLALLEYRNSPLACGKSPAQLLMSRQLRSVLPVTTDQLAPKVPCQEQVKSSMTDVRQRSKFYYDKKSRALQSFDIGERIRIRLGKFWKPAEVIDKINSRSYMVRTDNGAEYRRNRYHLLKTNEAKVQENQSSTQTFNNNSNNHVQNNPDVVLGQNENNTLQSQQTDTQTQPVNTNTQKNDKCLVESGFRTTRSGRRVKPPQRLSY